MRGSGTFDSFTSCLPCRRRVLREKPFPRRVAPSLGRLRNPPVVGPAIVLILFGLVALIAGVAAAASTPEFVDATFTGRGLGDVVALDGPARTPVFSAVETGLLGAPTEAGRTRVAEGTALALTLVDAPSRGIIIDGHGAGTVTFTAASGVTLEAVAARAGGPPEFRGVAVRVEAPAADAGRQPIPGYIVAYGSATLAVDGARVTATLANGDRVLVMLEPAGAFLDAVGAHGFAADVLVNASRDDVVRGRVATWARDEIHPGDRASWDLVVTGNRSAMLRVTTPPSFFSAIDRVEQIVPEINRAIPGDVALASLADVAETAVAYNASRLDDGRLQFLVKLPGSAAALDDQRFELLLRRDVTPPRVTSFRPGIPSPTGFIVEVVVDEPASAHATILDPGGGDPVLELASPRFKADHAFLAKNLAPGTNYTYTILLTDHAGNQRTAGPYVTRTADQVAAVKPRLTEIAPGDGAVVEAAPEIRATWALPAGATVDPATGIRLIFDGEPVPRRAVTTTATSVRFDPGDIPPGVHSVRLEVRTIEGETAVGTWSFTLLDDTAWFLTTKATTAFIVAGVAAAIAGGAVLVRRVRSGGSR